MSSTPLPRPEPVTRAAVIAGAVSGLIITIGGLARALGWLTDDLDVHAVARQASDLILGAGVLWSTVAPFVLALWARSKVTPLADPRDRDGNPLVIEGELAGPVLAVVDPDPTAVMPAVPEPTPTPVAAVDDTLPAMTAARG